MAADPHYFELPWRPNVEKSAALAWGGMSIAALALSFLTPQPLIGLGPAALCAIAGFARGNQSFKRDADKARLDKDGLDFIDPKEFIKKVKAAADRNNMWTGYGFPWSDIEANRMHHILDEGVVKVLGPIAQKEGGAWWVHGMANETDLESALANKQGHFVVAGTTRVGKSRFLELAAGGAIVRDECVIVFDPKNEGMAGLAGTLKNLCGMVGQPERFVYLNLAFPQQSVRVDGLKNFSSPTELPSRVAPLVPSETGNDTFTAFAWDVLNAQTLGMLYVGEKVSLKKYRFYTEMGVADLLRRVTLKFFDETLEGRWGPLVEAWAKEQQGGVRGKKEQGEGTILVRESLNLLLQYYMDVMAPAAKRNEAIEALYVIYKHPGEHFSKMIANLRPVLTKLTTGEVGDLLSPDPLNVSDPRPITDMQSLVRSKAVVYIGLNSMADASIGSAVGALLLSDLVAVAGNRNNYTPDDKTPINIHIDESSEILNDQAIQLMNKGGGSGCHMFIYTQTFADFEAKLGNAAKARQVLGNANNRIAFRVLDKETQEYIVDGIPPFKKKELSMRYGHNVDTRIHDEYTASYQEQVTAQEAQLIPPAMLGELPTLHFYARFSGGLMKKGRIPILQFPKAA